MTPARKVLRSLIGLLVGLEAAAVSLVGCTIAVSGAPTAGNKLDAGAVDDAGPDLFAPQVRCDDDLATLYDNPGPLTVDRGSLLRCATDAPISRQALQDSRNADGYVGAPFTSGAKVFRVVFRTERGDDAKSAGYSSAVVYVPDTPRASALPVVVYAHGTVGQAPSCAPSKFAFDGASDFIAGVLPLVGAGYAVIAPDYAGYMNFDAPGNPLGGYAIAADEGKSVIDSVTAIRTMFPSVFTFDIMLVGHSQGGHAVLSALAMLNDYPIAGAVRGAVLYSPMWFNQATWGALLAVSAQYPIKDSPFTTLVSLWYHYTHSELLDGQGHGGDVFAADKRAGIRDLVNGICGGTPADTALADLGNEPADLFDPTFASDVEFVAAGGAQCKTPLCDKWMARYAADRPHLGKGASSIPILIEYGANDTTIPPDRATCGFDRLNADARAINAPKPTICVSNDTHSSVVRTQSSYANDWIAARTLSGPEPPACAADQSALVTSEGAPVACSATPPND
jgi:pimeloyl-ACP methyl ester carboxylesterase